MSSTWTINSAQELLMKWEQCFLLFSKFHLKIYKRTSFHHSPSENYPNHHKIKYIYILAVWKQWCLNSYCSNFTSMKGPDLLIWQKPVGEKYQNRRIKKLPHDFFISFFIFFSLDMAGFRINLISIQ